MVVVAEDCRDYQQRFVAAENLDERVEDLLHRCDWSTAGTRNQRCRSTGRTIGGRREAEARQGCCPRLTYGVLGQATTFHVARHGRYQLAGQNLGGGKLVCSNERFRGR